MPKTTDGIREWSATQVAAFKLALSSRQIVPAAWTPAAIRTAIVAWAKDASRTAPERDLLLLDLVMALLPFDED